MPQLRLLPNIQHYPSAEIISFERARKRRLQAANMNIRISSRTAWISAWIYCALFWTAIGWLVAHAMIR